MGGKGSGNWSGSAKRALTGECIRLTMDDLRNSEVIAGKTNEVIFSWSTSESKGDIASVRVSVTSRTVSEVIMNLRYNVTLDDDSREVNETVSAVNANQKGTGKWYFRCPAEADGKPCDQHAAILYLPPDQEYFACRRCHDLAYSKAPKKEKTEGDQQSGDAGEQLDYETPDSWEPPGQPGQTADEASSGEREPGPSPQPLFFYIDHTLKLLDPGNTTISNKGRIKMVGELLSKMIREDGLSEERFSQAICEIQSIAPKAVSAYASHALREGSLSVGTEVRLAYFPLHRLGRIFRLHLAEDLDVTSAADLLLVDTAITALVQTRILLSRATPLSPESGISIKEEKLLRSQAIAQQKIFLAAMEKLQSKPSRTLAKSPAKKKTG